MHCIFLAVYFFRWRKAIMFLGEITLVCASSPIATRLSVSWSVVCRLSSVPLVQPANTVWRISMPFGRYTYVVQWPIVSDGGSLPPMGRGDFGVEPTAEPCTCLLIIHQGAALSAILHFTKLLQSLVTSSCFFVYLKDHSQAVNRFPCNFLEGQAMHGPAKKWFF